MKNNNSKFSTHPIVPIKIYFNANVQKSKILKDNQGRAGIYLFKNLINGNKYSIKYLERCYSLRICRAFLKYEHNNFSLTILEYCEPEKCIEREDHFLKLLKPEYNILQKAGSSLGFKHSDDSRKKMLAANNSGLRRHFKKGGPKPEGSGSPAQQIKVTNVQTNQKTTYNSMGEAARALNLSSHKIISQYIKNNQQTPYKARDIFSKED
jgi:hypothetical protein